MSRLSSLIADCGKQNFVRIAWDTLHGLPGGTRAFSKLIGLAAPYTATIHAHVVHVERGRAEVTMNDTRDVRNHIECIHAVALANLVELTGNIALAYSLPDDGRFIVAKMNVEYIAKARGPIRAIGTCDVPETSERRELEVLVRIENADGKEVTRGTLSSLVGPKKS